MENNLSFERMKDKDCLDSDSLRSYAVENGRMTSHLEDFEVVDGGGSVTNGDDLCPMTPIPHRKKGESVLVVSTPLSSESPQSPTLEALINTRMDEVVCSGCEDSPQTPEEGMFNPFAPGPEEMCLAPRKKLVEESRRIVARRLDFDDVNWFTGSIEDDKDAEIRLEKMLLDMVYGTILEAILSKRAEDFLAENQNLDLNCCRTPSSTLPLNGISETCPEAPAKGTTRKTLNIDPGLCRKLEF